MITIETVALWENLPAISAFADEAEATLPLSEEQSFILRLVVEEIVTNIIKYGYPDEPGPVSVSSDYSDNTLTLCIRDRGAPFDPRDAALPDLSHDIDTRQSGGLGIFLVLDMVDTLDYASDAVTGWNTLTITKRQTPRTLFELLRQISLFSGFTDDLLAELAQRAEERTLSSGEVLFSEGDEGHNCFVLLTGHLQVVKELGAQEILLDTVHNGSIIGEMALLDRSPRSATVRAMSDVRLLVLNEDDFYDLMHNNPVAAMDLLRGGTARLRGSNQRMVAGLQQKNAELSRAYEELKAAQADQLRLERIQQELDVARRIQEVFLPREVPQPAGWQVATLNRGAQEVGGDFYDCMALPVADGGAPYLGFVVADVCGKGVPAALFVALTRSLLRAAAQWSPADAPQAIVERAMRLTNDYIAVEHGVSMMFVTLFYGVLEPTTGALAYINAGHNPPLLLRATSGEIVSLSATDIPLGIYADRSYAPQHIALAPGDLLVAFTDGITEAMNPSDEVFGDEPLIEVLRANAHGNAHSVLAAILAEVTTFVAGAPPSDDMTLVVVSRDSA